MNRQQVYEHLAGMYDCGLSWRADDADNAQDDPDWQQALEEVKTVYQQRAELLAALEAIAAVHPMSGSKRCVELARAAIAQAKGE
jgi:hypothetical protein